MKTANSGLSTLDINTILAVLKQFPEITEAHLFGSRAMGNYKKGSDIDIAIKGKVSPETTSRLKSILEEETCLPYFFDIVDYNQISNLELKAHIDEYGVRFYP